MNRIKIVFVIDKIGFSEICTIPTLSSLAKKEGHQVELIDFSANPRKAYKSIISGKPDIVCYSVCSNETARYLEINSILKSKARFFSLFGGPHPTFFPDFIKEDGVDAICRGEGDISFPLFLRSFGKEQMYNTGNFYFKGSKDKIVSNELCTLVHDLDELPFPDRDIIYSKSYFMKKNPVKTFFAGRGCPFNCTYCFNHSFNEMYKGKGNIVRIKSIDYFLNEIKEVKSRYPLSFLKFHDDIFGIDEGWFSEFADRYPKEIGLPFFSYVRPNMVTERYASLLKKAGCHSVCLAIECGNERIRNQVLNRNLTDKQIREACNILNGFGLKIYSLNMIGLPGESEKDVLDTIELNRQVGAAFSDASIFQPYPGTRINNYCKEKGYLSENAKVFGGQYSSTVLNFEEDFKEKIYLLQRLFSMLVDHPFLISKIGLLYRWKARPVFKKVINFIYRCYYGKNLHSRIYASKIPLSLRLRGSIFLFSSKSRS